MNGFIGTFEIFGPSSKSINRNEFTDIDLITGNSSFKPNDVYGIQGNGIQVRILSNGRALLCVDDIVVRKRFSASAQVFQQVRALNGRIFITDCGSAISQGYKKEKPEEV
jgi:hypothetical protein